MTADEEIRALKEQLREALERLEAMEAVQAENQALHNQLAEAKLEIGELKKQKTPPPAFVKANKKVPEEAKQPRKKRDTKYNQGRRRSSPTQIVEHRVVNCPTCQMRLGGISVARSREIIDIPPPAAIEVTEHRIYKGYVAKTMTKVDGRGEIPLVQLDCHSKQLGNQCNLASHISFVHALQLSFPYHVHGLKSLQGSPRCLEREKAHPRLGQPFHEPMILFNHIVEILHLPEFTAFGNESCNFQFIERFGIGRVFVHVDDSWFVGMRGGKRFEKEALGGLGIPCWTEKELERVAL